MINDNCAAVIPSFSFEDLEARSETMLHNTIVTALVTFTPRVALVNTTNTNTHQQSSQIKQVLLN